MLPIDNPTFIQSMIPEDPSGSMLLLLVVLKVMYNLWPVLFFIGSLGVAWLWTHHEEAKLRARTNPVRWPEDYR
jgi:hypothetical protein